MPLPTSGLITLGQVNLELGKAENAAISLNDAAVRSLAGKPSGAISMSDLHGKGSIITSGHTLVAGVSTAKAYPDSKTAGRRAPEWRGFATNTVNGEFLNTGPSMGSRSPTTYRGRLIEQAYEAHGNQGSYTTYSRVDFFNIALRKDVYDVNSPTSTMTLGANYIKRVIILSGSTSLYSLDVANATFTESVINGDMTYHTSSWTWVLPANSAFKLTSGTSYTLQIQY